MTKKKVYFVNSFFISVIYVYPIWVDRFWDLSAHIRLFKETVELGNFKIIHPVFHILYYSLEYSIPYISSLQAGVIVQVLCKVFSGLILCKILMERFEKMGALKIISSVCFLLSVGPISVFTFPKLYLGYVGMNVAHNPTIIALQPIALYSFYIFYIRKGCYANIGLVKNVIMTILSTMTKPVYHLVFGTGMLLNSLGKCIFFQKKWKDEFKSSLIILVVYFLIAVPQATLVYKSLRGGVSIAPFSMLNHWNSNIIFTILFYILSALFPLSNLFWGACKDNCDEKRVAWLSFIVGSLIAILFIEKGAIWSAGNYTWFWQLPLWILFVVCFIDYLTLKEASKLGKKTIFIINSILFLHLVSGLMHLYNLPKKYGDDFNPFGFLKEMF